MKVPHFINRVFPVLDEYTKLKSSQLKIFIFYWSVPLLMNILPVSFWYHLCEYAFSVRCLYEPIGNKDDIESADEMINSYVRLAEDFYGEDVADYTLHAHLHLPNQVLKHGPLHCNSQFVFEVNK